MVELPENNGLVVTRLGHRERERERKRLDTEPLQAGMKGGRRKGFQNFSTRSSFLSSESKLGTLLLLLSSSPSNTKSEYTNVIYR